MQNTTTKSNPVPKINLDTMNATQLKNIVDKYGKEQLPTDDYYAALQTINHPRIPSLENFKDQARILRLLSGDKIKASESLELLSKSYGKKNWNIMKSSLSPGNICEGSFADRFLLDHVIPVFTKWNEHNQLGTFISDIEGNINEPMIMSFYASLMLRCPNDGVYVNTISHIAHDHPDLLLGIKDDHFSTRLQIKENWYAEAELIGYLVQHKMTSGFPNLLSRLQKQSEVDKWDYVEEITKAVEHLGRVNENQVRCIVHKDKIYPIPLSVVLSPSLYDVEDHLNKEDLKALAKLGIEVVCTLDRKTAMFDPFEFDLSENEDEHNDNHIVD